MAISNRLRDLIDRSAKLWAGEAEIVRTYFQSASRTRESDRAWLERQCFKEIWGSGLTGRNESLIQGWSKQLSNWFPKNKRGRWFGLFNTSSNLGAALTPVLASC